MIRKRARLAAWAIVLTFGAVAVPTVRYGNPFVAFAQNYGQRNVSGAVVDGDSSPVPGATIFLNSDDPNLAGLSFSINDQFLSTVPPSLGAGETSSDIELFDVTLSDPLQDAFATYAGDYTLVGGIDGDAQDNIGSATFSVTSVPEPSAIGLLLTGFAGLLPIRSRLRRRA